MAKRKKTPSRSESGKSPQVRPRRAAGRPDTKAEETDAPKREKAAGQPAKSGSESKHADFPIVGIGASAGGMEAFSQILRRLSPKTGMAFVFVQHLHPGYESALTEILARETAMPVIEVKDDMAVQPDHVYVIPPGYYLGIQYGVLELLPRPPAHERRLPVDQFFRYLAADHGSGAIGVVLSGTGSDGVLGLKAVKAEGGITFAQDEASAKYDGMPHSAISSGAVDFILPPERIAAELEHVARHPLVAHQRVGRTPGLLSADGGILDKILMMMRRHSGHDFTYYKPTTIQRRIRRRMVLHKLERPEDYVRYLQDTPAELDELFHDILINVTDFFRDPEVFEVLVQKVFPAMVPADRSTDHPVRIWVPGCSSGEEAYSIAIALLEYLGERAATTPVQIFATDIDEIAINRARAGLYPDNITQDVSPERLRRFFTRIEGGYQINKGIRDMCVFAEQNVAKDPPFSHLDFVSCRNLLIYLGPVLQKRVMRTFHYALKPDGFLLLGTAESIGEFSDLFRAVDAKARIYARKAIAVPVHVQFGMPVEPTHQSEATILPGGGRPGDPGGAMDVQKEADRVLMSRYTPPGVVINDDMEILAFRGHTGAYLEPTPGEASLSLLKMARQDLIVALSAAVRESMASHTVATSLDIHLKVDGRTRRIDIEVTPLPISGVSNLYYLVVFREPSAAVEPGVRSSKRPAKGEAGKSEELAHLEQELAATKEYLQSVIEQKETNNEELRSANEEIQSSNEELQSINEELETAKEELQSTNEELATVNDELESRNNELARVNNDLTNPIASVNIAIVIVSQDLRIRRFTPQAEKLLNLISSDVGRPVSDITANIEVPQFTEMLTAAVDQVQTREENIQDKSGHWYSVRVRPYKTLDNKIDGAVAIFIDVDMMKRALEDSRAARDYAEAIVTAVRHPMLVLDRDLKVVSASAAYLETFEVSDKETRENLVYRLGNGQWAIPKLRQMLERVITEDGTFNNFEMTHDFERIGRRTFRISGRRIPAGAREGPMVLMQIEGAGDVRGGVRG